MRFVVLSRRVKTTFTMWPGAPGHIGREDNVFEFFVSYSCNAMSKSTTRNNCAMATFIRIGGPKLTRGADVQGIRREGRRYSGQSSTIGIFSCAETRWLGSAGSEGHYD